MRGRIKLADKNDNNNNNNIDDDDDDDEIYIPSISCCCYHARCSYRRLYSFYYYALILFSIVMTDSVLLFSEGLSSSSSSASYPPSSSSSSEESPWASSTWLLKLDFCRSKQTSSQQKQNDNTGSSNSNNNKNNNDDAPFTSYGALGSRLVVNFPIMVDADDDMNNKQYPDKFVGRGASVIRPNYDADDDDNNDEEDERNRNRNKNTNNYFEYITMKGTQRIELSQGGWTVEFPSSGIYNRGKATKLKFYLDLVTDLERNDIVLPAGTRLYFTTKCWREQEYDYGLIKIKPIRDEFQIAQQILDDQLSHESGDRRLDGNDPIETLKAYKDMTKLVLNRDRKRMELRNAINGQKDYGHGYPGSDDHPEGPWPGSTEWLTISENNPIYARVPKKNDKNKNNLLQQLISKGGGGGGDNDYHFGRVGTWTGEAISSLLLEDDE